MMRVYSTSVGIEVKARTAWVGGCGSAAPPRMPPEAHHKSAPQRVTLKTVP